MLRTLTTVACFVLAVGTSGGDTCTSVTGLRNCAPALVNDHSLLQVHPAAKNVAVKEHNSTEDKRSKASGTALQQENSARSKSTEKRSFSGKADTGIGSDPYPEDYDLDTDYPRDDKGTHADTIREVQSATLPGDGDVGKNTKPGLSDSWNVDKMFVTDSDGGGHVSLRDMIPWGYRSQNKALQTNKDAHSGLIIEKTSHKDQVNADDKAVVKDQSKTKTAPHEVVDKAKKGAAGGDENEQTNNSEDETENEGEDDVHAGQGAKNGPKATAALPEARDDSERETVVKDENEGKEGDNEPAEKNEAHKKLHEGKANDEDEDEEKALLIKADSSHGQKDKDEADAHAMGKTKAGPDATAALPKAKNRDDIEAAEKDEYEQKDETSRKNDDQQNDDHKNEAKSKTNNKSLSPENDSPGDKDADERNDDS